MPTAEQYQQVFELVTTQAVADSVAVSRTVNADTLIDAVVPLIAHYSDGTAALAADSYDDIREVAEVPSSFRASPVVRLRDEKIRRGLLWAAGPLYGEFPDVELGESRIAEVVQLETARPFRDTILANSQRDPSSVGWRRNPNIGACKYCRMLADKGAIYRESTARFAAHANCSCSASPVFDGDAGPEASALQYVASQKSPTPAQRAQLRNHLASLPD